MELLCIQTHSQKAVIAGNIYHFISDKCPCSCHAFDVGVPFSGCLPITRCDVCGKAYLTDSIYWVASVLFAPIASEEEVKEQETIKEEASV